MNDNTTSRHATIVRMASDLIRFDALNTREDSLRSLMCDRGRYSTYEIAMLVDEARAVAVQERVAREMSES
jgi:hypothetical protein